MRGSLRRLDKALRFGRLSKIVFRAGDLLLGWFARLSWRQRQLGRATQHVAFLG
jgi:hypothetical protein